MALKKIPSLLKSAPKVMSNHNRELVIPTASKVKTSRVGKMRATGKSLAQQIADNLKCRTTVIGRTLRGVRKV